MTIETTPEGSEILVHWLGSPESRDRELVGGKAANLGALFTEFTVPPGFCLSAWSLAVGGTVAKYRDLLAEAYAELGRHCGEDTPAVAVRSSAIDEDGAVASFAGQHDTFLNATGIDAVADAVAECFASFHSHRAGQYRREHGLEAAPRRCAVLVQRLVPADVSGVLFSVNPVSANPDEVVINASWGLGESIVGGTVTPDVYVADKATGNLLYSEAADKQRMTIPVRGGTREVDVPSMVTSQRVLSEKQVAEAVRLGVEMERRHGLAVDLELAWSDQKLHLLQCRPAT